MDHRLGRRGGEGAANEARNLGSLLLMKSLQY